MDGLGNLDVMGCLSRLFLHDNTVCSLRQHRSRRDVDSFSGANFQGRLLSNPHFTLGDKKRRGGFFCPVNVLDPDGESIYEGARERGDIFGRDDFLRQDPSQSFVNPDAQRSSSPEGEKI